MAKSVYVFVDNSNLWIEGKKVSGQQQNPPVSSNYRYRIEYGSLLSHVLGGRKMGDIPRLYGSEPPPNDSVWRIIQSKGFDVTVFKRNIFNKEKGVDMRMGVNITKLVVLVKPPGIIALVAGDADFLPVLDEAKAAAWEVEVWYWSNAAQLLQQNATRFIALNPSLDAVGFEDR